jgi:hypothetical protein
MIPTSLIVVADRGSLKAYRVDKTPTRGPSLHLVQAFDLTDAHGRFIDKVSDLAGRFSASNGAGPHHGQASIAEKTQLEAETHRRIEKQLADEIVKLVGGNKDGWSFAASSDIHGAIVDHLPPAVRDRIVEHVKSDLVKIEPAKLQTHFRSLHEV